MTSHDSCTSGTSRVLTVASSQHLKLVALISAPADCEVRSMIKFLYTHIGAPNEIHRQFCQQSFPADYPLLVAQNYHGVSVAQKIVRQVGAKATDSEHKAKRMESALTKLRSIFSYTSINPCPVSVSVYRMTERRRLVSHSGSNPRRQTFTTQGFKCWSHGLTCLNSGGEYVEK